MPRHLRHTGTSGSGADLQQREGRAPLLRMRRGRCILRGPGAGNATTNPHRRRDRRRSVRVPVCKKQDHETEGKFTCVLSRFSLHCAACPLTLLLHVTVHPEESGFRGTYFGAHGHGVHLAAGPDLMHLMLEGLASTLVFCVATYLANRRECALSRFCFRSAVAL